MKRVISRKDRAILSAVFMVLEYNALGAGGIEGFYKVRRVLDNSSTGHFYTSAIEELDRLITASKRAQAAPALSKERKYHQGIGRSLHIGKRILEEVRE